MSAPTMPRGIAAGPVPSCDVHPDYCGYCRAEVPHSYGHQDAGITYCGPDCYEARLDELAAHDDRGWEPSADAAWTPIYLRITKPTTS